MDEPDNCVYKRTRQRILLPMFSIGYIDCSPVVDFVQTIYVLDYRIVGLNFI